MRRLLPWLLPLLFGCSAEPEAPAKAANPLQTYLGSDSGGFARAMQARPFAFPADHGNHPGYRSEWWYFTGNLDGMDGARFGYQFTLFRFGLDPAPAPRSSAWAASQVWMAHLALSSASDGHVHAERFARDALGLAGVEADPLRLWLGDWQLRTRDDGRWQLDAAADAFRVTLTLEPIRPVVAQGEHGLSRKGPEPGNASHYYSIPRLRTEGSVVLHGRSHEVSGLSWLDREWGTSALGPELAGWDWFSLQLADGRDLMYYRLRRKDGSSDPLSRGSLLTADGRRVDLDGERLGSRPLRYWQAPDGTRYPVAWELTLDGERWHVEAVRDDQWMPLSVRYWEGMVDVRDATDGSTIGRGYLELAGY